MGSRWSRCTNVGGSPPALHTAGDHNLTPQGHLQPKCEGSLCVCVRTCACQREVGGIIKVQWKKHGTELEILLFNPDFDMNLLLIYRIFNLCALSSSTTKINEPSQISDREHVCTPHTHGYSGYNSSTRYSCLLD